MIHPKQFCFRAQNSSQLINIINDITNSSNHWYRTTGNFLDVMKVFNKFQDDGLIYKLIIPDVPNQLTNLIYSFKSNRTFYIRVNYHKYTIRNIQSGVPKGSCLSPRLFFSMYINDMPQDPTEKQPSSRTIPSSTPLVSCINLLLKNFKNKSIQYHPSFIIGKFLLTQTELQQ